MKIRKPVLLHILIVILFLQACNVAQKENFSINQGVQKMALNTPVSIEVDPTLDDERIGNRECITEFMNKKIQDQPDYDDPQKATLSEIEFQEYMNRIGIQDICIPKQLGAPFINVEICAEESPGTTGYMVSIGFENTYSKGGWSDVFIIFASYDFEAGIEHDVFSTVVDFEANENGMIGNMIEGTDRKNFIRFESSKPMGGQYIYKTIIFPSESDYLGIVYNLGVFNPDEVEGLLEEFNTNGYTNSSSPYLDAVNQLARSLKFLEDTN